MASAMRRVGYLTLTAATVEEAFELLGCERVDVVVTDLNMPGLGGLDLLAQLAADAEETPPVVVVTGSDDETDLRTAALLGARAVLTKPCALVDVTAAVHEILHPPPVPLDVRGEA
jgi:CheY-like chemotaxis protein